MEDMEVISRYTSDDAVEDGILFEVKQITKQDGAFSHITTNLLEKKGYFSEEKINVPAIFDLLNQCVIVVNDGLTKNGMKADTFYSGTIKDVNDEDFKVFIGANEYGKFTIMLPEDY